MWEGVKKKREFWSKFVEIESKLNLTDSSEAALVLAHRIGHVFFNMFAFVKAFWPATYASGILSSLKPRVTGVG